MADVTGKHFDGIIVLDDVVSRNVVKEAGGSAKVEDWYENTIIPISKGRKRARIRGFGTRWDPDDLWQGFIDDPYWLTIVRGFTETDSKPDPNGIPIYVSGRRWWFPMIWILALRACMKFSWAQKRPMIFACSKM